MRKRYLQYGALIAAVLTAIALTWAYLAAGRTAVVEFAMLQPNDTPTAIAVAPDQTVWFTLDSVNAIGRIRQGKLERLPEPGMNAEPIGLAVTPDGAAWYPDAPARQIHRVSPAGEVVSLTLETPIAKLGKIAAAPDGAVWFTEASMYSITRLKDGQLERHVIDSMRGGPLGIAVAPDGSVWASLQAANQLLQVTANGEMKAFDIPTPGSSPSDVVVDRTGAVWFLEFRGNRIGRLQDGRFEEFSLGPEAVGLSGLSVAQDGSVWFGMLRKAALGRLRDGAIEYFPLPRKTARPYGVAIDAQDNVWYTDITGFVGQLPARQARR